MATNFPTSFDSWYTKYDGEHFICASHINNLQDAINALEIKVGADSSATDTTLDYKVNIFFEEGVRRIYLYENTAPIDWTTIGVSDAVLAVKGGEYDGYGGDTAGTWLAASYTLTLSDIPSHTHSYVQGTDFIPLAHYSSAGAGPTNGEVFGQYTDYASSYPPGGLSHRHGSNTYRPYAAVGLLVQFDGS